MASPPLLALPARLLELVLIRLAAALLRLRRADGVNPEHDIARVGDAAIDFEAALDTLLLRAGYVAITAA
jgi:hypothetical protein